MLNKTRLTVALVAVVALLGAVGVGAAVLSSGSISADQPDNQQLVVGLNYSGAGTTTEINLSQDGTVVESTTDSADGTSTSPQSAVLDLQGLQTGHYNLSVSGADESNVSVAQTSMVTEQSGINQSANSTLTVDVEFDAEQTTNATVEWLDSTGSVINSTSLTFDPVEFSDGSGIKTAEFERSTSYNDTSVRVTTSSAYGHEAVYVYGGSSVGAGLFGASSNQVLGFLVLLAGLLVLSGREVL